jgi:hypothetical protein
MSPIGVFDFLHFSRETECRSMSQGIQPRRAIMALSLYSIYWNWRREVAAEREAAQHDTDVPLGIG